MLSAIYCFSSLAYFRDLIIGNIAISNVYGAQLKISCHSLILKVKFYLSLLRRLAWCVGVISKALEETHWPNDAFLSDEEQKIDDTEISATALEIWNSVKDLTVQYDGKPHKKDPLK